MYLEAFIDNHRITGSYDIASGYLITRLLTERMLRLEQVSVSRISKPGEIVATRKHAAIRVDTINLIIAQKMDAGRVLPLSDVQARIEAFITMPNFEVQGVVHAKAKRPSTGYLMSENTSVYLDPLLNGRAVCMSTGYVYEGYLFLIRKDRISMISLSHDAPLAIVREIEDLSVR